MITISNAMQSYLPPIWELFDDSDTDVPELIEGDLVEFDDYYGEYIGCGIIKRFTISEFKNPTTGKFEKLPCAIVVPATSQGQWLDYVPMTCLDPLSLSDYLTIYEAEYAEKLPDMQSVRMDVIKRMSLYSGAFGCGNLPSMSELKTFVQVGA